MYIIELVRGISYTDGRISADKKHPLAEVESEAAAQHYVDTGYFKLVGGGESSEEDDEGGEEELLFGEEEDDSQESTASSRLRAELSEKKVDELRGYAGKNGIDISGLQKKTEIIERIVEAQERAYAVRADLRNK